MAPRIPMRSQIVIAVLANGATSQQITSLGDYEWQLNSVPPNISTAASFPSYAHLDLSDGQIITGDLEYGLNDFDMRWVWQQNWTYSAQLSGLAKNASQTYLLFDGLDTFASIDLCGQHIASTDNQFRQWYFDVTVALATCSDDAVLSLNFGSAPQIASDIANQPGQETWPYGTELTFEIPNRQFIRKEGNDFGWDWGPAYAPAGPWKPGYVIQFAEGPISARNVLIDIYKLGQQNDIIPDQSQPWVLNASIDVVGALPSSASLTYVLQDSENSTVSSGTLDNVTQVNGAISGSTVIEKDSVSLWWPVGMGNQTLYYLTVEVRSTDNTTLTTVIRRTGFRTIVLNQQVVTDEEIATGVAPGNHWNFEINGYPFFAKGSNFVPPDVFWPRVTPDRIRTLFKSVIDGNQNMLRVWSTGAYSPDFMYDIADEMGILLWSEFEFGDCLYPATPVFLSSVYEEAVYQVRRVNSHPSLAYWAGGNEFENYILPVANNSSPADYPRIIQEYEKLFLSTIFPAVFENTHSISYLPSSTSLGYIALNFTDAPYMQIRYQNLAEPGRVYGETDYYNYNAAVAFNLSTYPVGRFSNEFGFHSMPSLQTWSSYVPESELYFNSTTIVLRNRHYPPGGLNTTNYSNSTKGMAEMTNAVELWYPVPDKSDSIANFSAWCWTTQVFQAEFYSSQIQFYKRGMGLPQRTLGSLYWQLEDQWAAPTWAGIERSSRWKILHYRAADLYQDVIISPFYYQDNGTLEAWVSNDLWDSIEGTASLDWYTYSGELVGTSYGLNATSVFVGALNSAKIYEANVNQALAATGLEAHDIVARLHVNATGRRPNSGVDETFEHTNWWHASRLSEARLVDPGLTVMHDEASKQLKVTATTGVSAWTWLDYPAGAVVHFSDNGFWLGKGESKSIGYVVDSDDTDATWIDAVTAYSLWNNTLS